MRLLVSWVRDFVDIDAPPAAIAEALALRGFEVAGIEPPAGGSAGGAAPWQTVTGPDGVIDFEVTANRPDCLSVLGLARELATVFERPLRPIPHAAIPVRPGTAVPAEVRVHVDDPVGCPRYAAGLAEVLPAATPLWMTARLLSAGVRPISPCVDVTNYVLMELGHPMHAFDLAALAGPELRIRRARAGETLTTLDGVERRLERDMLVIADASRAQALAGVMGGLASEVTARTRLVALESACFEPTTIRRTSKRLGLKTEASARFERGADLNAPVTALERALELMTLIGAGRPIGGPIDCYPSPRARTVLALRRERIAALLGLRVPDADVTRILTSLGLQVGDTPQGWAVEVPTFRVDLKREVDLIEEVGRHHGFDRLQSSFLPLVVAAPPPDPRVARDRRVREVATAAGLSEAVTFGFIEHDAAAAFLAGPPTELVRVGNPLSAKFEVLRPSLLPGLLDAVAHNRRHGQRDVRLFEIGARFTASAGETRGFAAAWTGAASPEHWSRSGREADFYDATGFVEQVCAVMHVSARFEPTTVPYLVPGQAAAVLVAGTPVGVVGRLTAGVTEARGAPRQDRVFVAEVDLEKLDAARPGEQAPVRPLPRHPSVVRDLSVVVSERLSAAIIRGTIQAAAARGPAPLVSIAFFDRYKGRGVGDQAVSVSVRLTFQAEDRTLTDAEVHNSVEHVLADLVRRHGAVQR
jgi:phenylalanyl-tRNA synthetase beta chain